MMIDYVRVYQRTDSQNVGCDPKDYPTADYIAKHSEAYNSACLAPRSCPQLFFVLSTFALGASSFEWFFIDESGANNVIGFVDPQLKHWQANDDGAGYNATFPRNQAVSQCLSCPTVVVECLFRAMFV